MASTVQMLGKALWLVLAALPYTEAKLPFGSTFSEEDLKRPGDVTFDPLGVAAILGNPRADASAARLYTQADKIIYRWPHTMMFGAALTPVTVLVDHLTSRMSSLHPAIAMCTKDLKALPVRATFVFKELRLWPGNTWLHSIMAFRSSDLSANDFMIANVDDAFGARKCKEDVESKALVAVTQGLISGIGWLTGLIMATALVFAVLTGDSWAIVLFFFYTVYWLASTVVSFIAPVKVRQPPIYDAEAKDRAALSARNKPAKDIVIRKDPKTQFAIHERPEGGTIVLKGRQDTFEAWARVSFDFERTLLNDVVHWTWMLSGTMAAITSVACMVNMGGIMQLVFLGTLIYSSIAEILLDRAAVYVQHQINHYATRVLVDNNSTRTMGIVRASLQVQPECRLAGLDWIKLGLLPDQQAFQNMQNVLVWLNDRDLAGLEVPPAGEIEVKMREGVIGDNWVSIADRITREMIAAVQMRREKELQGLSV